MTAANILVVDDEKNIRRTLSMVLQGEDHEVESVESAELGLQAMLEHSFDIVILDVQMSGMSGLEMLEQIKATEHPPEVIMMSGHATLSDAVNATRLGAFDFLEKPIDRERLLLTVRNCMEKRYLMLQVARLEDDDSKHLGMIGESAEMQKIRTSIERVAPTKGRVLILGESGVGKDLVARAIHNLSDRRKKAFVKINCSAIPSELIESELFGHERGAFTGAAAKKRGLFEIADGGSIFLDEIGDMSMSAQAKVLRVIEYGEFTRVGGEKLSKVDVRVIAATNVDLVEAVKVHKTFREDLLFRLKVVTINVPPLRERLSDVPLLTNSFLSQLSKEYGRELLKIDDRALNILCKYDFPGNIRELRNLCERFVIMASNPITVADLPDDIILEDEVSEEALSNVPDCLDNMIAPGSMSLRDFRLLTERAYIQATLKNNAWNVSKTAEILGMERTNLHKKIKKYGLERQELED